MNLFGGVVLREEKGGEGKGERLGEKNMILRTIFLERIVWQKEGNPKNADRGRGKAALSDSFQEKGAAHGKALRAKVIRPYT